MPFALLTTHIWQRKNSMPPSLHFGRNTKVAPNWPGPGQFQLANRRRFECLIRGPFLFHYSACENMRNKRSGQVPINCAQVALNPLMPNVTHKRQLKQYFSLSRTFWFFRHLTQSVDRRRFRDIQKFKKEGSVYFRVLKKSLCVSICTEPGGSMG